MDVLRLAPQESVHSGAAVASRPVFVLAPQLARAGLALGLILVGGHRLAAGEDLLHQRGPHRRALLAQVLVLLPVEVAPAVDPGLLAAAQARPGRGAPWDQGGT